MSKRSDYIQWDQYFMGLALLSTARSKDPSTQVGACVVKNNKVIGLGYNGLPNGMDDDEFSWSREGSFLESKYSYVCHSELNAIMNSPAPEKLHGSTMYVTLFPCNECAKIIVQSGISCVVYLDDKYNGTDANTASKKILDCAGIDYYNMINPTNKSWILDFDKGVAIPVKR